MEQHIFYGAGKYAKMHFNNFRRKYEPLCFCDRNAVTGQMLFGLPVLLPSAMLERYPDAPIVITTHPAHNKLDAQDYLAEELGIPLTRIVNHTQDEHYECATSCETLESDANVLTDSWSICCQGIDSNGTPNASFSETASKATTVTWEAVAMTK